MTRKELSLLLTQVQTFKEKCYELNTGNNTIKNGTPTTYYFVDKDGEFETINPIDYYKTKLDSAGLPMIDRSDSNCISLCNFVFEIDSMPLQDQEGLIWLNRKIINRVVFSGSKSYHSRVTISPAPKNKEEYKFVFSYINMKLFNSKCDTQCSNPSRLTRRPGSIRTFKPVYPGIEQLLIFENNTVCESQWQKAYQMQKEEDSYIEALRESIDSRPKAWFHNSDDYKNAINENAKAFLYNTVVDGERHQKCVSAALSFKAHGWSWNEIEHLFTQHSKDIGRLAKKAYLRQLS